MFLWAVLLFSLAAAVQYTADLPSWGAAELFAENHGLELVGRVSDSLNVYWFEGDAAARGVILPPSVVVQERRARALRTFSPPSDPSYSDQWHLHGATMWGSRYDVHVNVAHAWDANVTGAGVVVMLVDDGLDHEHLDIAPNYLAAYSRSVVTNSPDPRAGQGDTHGTQCGAAIAAARDNGVCGVGVAYNARLAAMHLLPAGRMPSDAEEAFALGASANADPPVGVYSNSWGEPDTGKLLGTVGRLTRAVMAAAARDGGGGKGAVYVWASGNGRRVDDQANLDGFCNGIDTVCVGALTDMGEVAWYSEGGPCVMLVAPSSGGFNYIYTAWGTSQDHSECTNRFSGTSAAAPQVAGVVALVREANPELTARDVMHVLIRSANARVIAAPGLYQEVAWDRNGAGLLHSDLAGFGLVDASGAVALARSWRLRPRRHEYVLSLPVATNMRDIEPHSTGIFTALAPVRNTSVVFNLEHVALDVDLSFRACQMHDLAEITVQSPDGTVSTMLTRNQHTRTELVWTFTSLKHWDEHPAGPWIVRVQNGGGAIVRVNHLKLRLYGTPRTFEDL